MAGKQFIPGIQKQANCPHLIIPFDDGSISYTMEIRWNGHVMVTGDHLQV